MTLFLNLFRSHILIIHYIFLLFIATNDFNFFNCLKKSRFILNEMAIDVENNSGQVFTRAIGFRT